MELAHVYDNLGILLILFPRLISLHCTIHLESIICNQKITTMQYIIKFNRYKNVNYKEYQSYD